MTPAAAGFLQVVLIVMWFVPTAWFMMFVAETLFGQSQFRPYRAMIFVPAFAGILMRIFDHAMTMMHSPSAWVLTQFACSLLGLYLMWKYRPNDDDEGHRRRRRSKKVSLVRGRLQVAGARL